MLYFNYDASEFNFRKEHTMNQTETCLSFLWAKKKDQNGRFFWLPLIGHLKDTMGVMDFLWNHWMSEGQKEIIIHALSDTGEEATDTAHRLTCFLAGIHDIGKCTPVFQTQKGYQNSQDLDIALLNRLEQVGLTGISTLKLDDDARKRSHHTVTGEYLLQCLRVQKDVASIVGAHHGKPVDREEAVVNLKFYPRYCFQDEKEGSCQRLWLAMQKEILNRALKNTGFVDSEGNPEVASLPKISETGQVLLSGLVIMADWIASNEAYFPLIPLEEGETETREERLQHGMMTWREKNPVEATEVMSIPDVKEYYRERFDFPPRSFQQKVFDTIANTENPGIFILEAPMGCGKTEAALTAAEELMAEKKLDGLFFGLPTQATSNGIFPRIEDWFNRFAETYDKFGIMKLMHGKAALNELQEELIGRVNIYEEMGAGVLTSQWFAGKKTAILSDAVVGTVDHFLLAALKQKHLALRHLGFSKKVVIIDEVHAYDAYMDVFLSRAIEWMGAYGIPVMLLSATLPKGIREKLIQAYLLGQGKGIRIRDKKKYAPIFQAEAYPLLTYTDEGTVQQRRDFTKEEDRCVAVRQLEEDHLEETLEALLVHGGVAGVIVNTVGRAQALFERLMKVFGTDVSLLHAKFIDTDRVAKEKVLMKNIGKEAKRPWRAIVIGTQVLEQSLDIDFDVLITDLCPMDLLLQRIGRLHRHQISRPEGLSTPVLYVMGQSDTLTFEKGASAIYGDYLLARTQKLLPQEIFLPRDISPLVQSVYDDTAIHWDKGLQESYESAKAKHEIKIMKKTNTAQNQFLLQKPHLKIKPDKYNLIGWLDTAAIFDSEENALAQVRDAEESIEVIVLMKYDAGYGFFCKKEDISHQVENYKVAKEIAKQTLKLSSSIARLAFGSVQKTIEWLENYNRKNLYSWQQQPWLKGSLGILFEPVDDGKTGKFHLGDVTLVYNYNIGLQMFRNNDREI